LKIVRLLWWTAAVLFAGARPAIAATVTAQVTAQVNRPLTLAGKQDLNFGTIIMTKVTAPVTVSVSTAGVLTCGAGLTCFGTVTPAIYNVTGSNNQVVYMYAPPVNLTNAANGQTIRLTPILPPGNRLTLTNSGQPGSDFKVGGSIVLGPTTADGRYAGDINVTVDYN
jgi:hypothetical protein